MVVSLTRCGRLLTSVVRVLLGGIIRLLIPVASLSSWWNHPALVRSSPTSIDLISIGYWSFLEFSISSGVSSRAQKPWRLLSVVKT
ncbi:hypothetical protein HA466_0177870 [Hirschfeldia incana]|nr:hypothetical protein HA466_0177870 [Hirschfeldia incana]